MGLSRTFLSVFVAMTVLTCGANLSAQGRPALPIAYISLQKILTEAEDAKAAGKELEALRTARAQDVNAKRQALDATKLQLANAGGVFSGSKRQQITELAKRQEAELQQATQRAQIDLQELQKKVQDRLRQELGTIVTALAQQRGVQYVLNQDVSIVLAPNGANWTAEVLQRLNAAAAERAASEKSSTEKPDPKKP
jgi:Skp family chaperone for outer membrane proteins